MTTSKAWTAQEREIITKFFHEKVPEALDTTSSSTSSPCTEESCIQFAQTLLHAPDIIPVDNQGSNSFTLVSPSLALIIQFRLKPFKTDTLHLAHRIYGDLVPAVEFHDGFSLPVYTTKLVAGRVHVLQPFSGDKFPLAREKLTVEELALFIARAAFFEQEQAKLSTSSWTTSAKATLDRLTQNTTLKILAPNVFEIFSHLRSQIHLLDTLPAVLTHHDFSQINILVNDDGNVTGVVDFDEAGVEAFGMCTWGLYECFLGSMEGGKWSFYDMPVPEEDDSGERGEQSGQSGQNGQSGQSRQKTQSVFEVLERTFWESLWANVPPSLTRNKAEKAVKLSLSIGIIRRYFVQGMIEEIDLSRRVHCLSLEYVKGILPRVWTSDIE